MTSGGPRCPAGTVGRRPRCWPRLARGSRGRFHTGPSRSRLVRCRTSHRSDSMTSAMLLSTSAAARQYRTSWRMNPDMRSSGQVTWRVSRGLARPHRLADQADAIDGTASFLAGEPEWGTAIVLAAGDAVSLGVVTDLHDAAIGVWPPPARLTTRDRQRAATLAAQARTTLPALDWRSPHHRQPQSATINRIRRLPRRPCSWPPANSMPSCCKEQDPGTSRTRPDRRESRASTATWPRTDTATPEPPCSHRRFRHIALIHQECRVRHGGRDRLGGRE